MLVVCEVCGYSYYLDDYDECPDCGSDESYDPDEE